jgi:hypothetical protein
MRNFLSALLLLVPMGILPGTAVASSNDAAGRPDVPDTPSRPSRTALAIRIYHGGLVRPENLVAAVTAAGGILGTAGLDVYWRICLAQPEGAGVDPCGEPLGAREVTIRFLVGGPLAPNPPANVVQGSQVSRVPLGTSLIDTETGAGSLATIYVDRVAGLALDARTRADILLGRAIAHEIGHLLMGTTGHARTGLMRAIWTTGELRRDDATDWLFAPGDGRSMQLALLTVRH